MSSSARNPVSGEVSDELLGLLHSVEETAPAARNPYALTPAQALQWAREIDTATVRSQISPAQADALVTVFSSRLSDGEDYKGLTLDESDVRTLIFTCVYLMRERSRVPLARAGLIEETTQALERYPEESGELREEILRYSGGWALSETGEQLAAALWIEENSPEEFKAQWRDLRAYARKQQRARAQMIRAMKKGTEMQREARELLAGHTEILERVELKLQRVREGWYELSELDELEVELPLGQLLQLVSVKRAGASPS